MSFSPVQRLIEVAGKLTISYHKMGRNSVAKEITHCEVGVYIPQSTIILSPKSKFNYLCRSNHLMRTLVHHPNPSLLGVPIVKVIIWQFIIKSLV
jgi:hypothetical protein